MKINKIMGIIAVIVVVLFLLPSDEKKMGAGTSVDRGVDRSTVYLNDIVTVTLTIDAVSGDKAILIHEEAPFTITGLTSNVYETALLDQIQVTDTIKTYTFTASSTGTKTFSGIFNVNNEGDRAISGTSSISVVSCTSTAETCNNVDDDCDYSIDESLSQSCYSGPSGTQGVGICQAGAQTCSAGSWSSCSGEVTPQTEICDSGIDEDCDGSTLTRNSVADGDCDQLVSWTEMNNAISDWLIGSVTWTEINTAIGAWLI